MIDIFNELEKEIAERIKRNSELVLAALHGDVPVETEIEEAIRDVELRMKEAEIVEKVLEKGVEESNKELIDQCAWWVGSESLFLSSIVSTLKRALEELRRRQK